MTMKWIASNGKYKFKVETWESNKGQPGFMAWKLMLWLPELEHWYMLDGSHRNYPLHPENAERIAKEEFLSALSGNFDTRIQQDIIGEAS